MCDKCYSELTNEVNSRDIVKSSNNEKRPTRPPPTKATANKKEQHRVDSGSSGEESDDDGDQTDDLEVETQVWIIKIMIRQIMVIEVW